MEVENEKDDDLVQVELPDRFSLLDEHDIEDLTFLKMRRKKKEFKKSKSSLSIQESIYFYK